MEQDIKQEIVSIQLDNESTIPLVCSALSPYQTNDRAGKTEHQFQDAPDQMDGRKASDQSGNSCQSTRSLKRTAF